MINPFRTDLQRDERKEGSFDHGNVQFALRE